VPGKKAEAPSADAQGYVALVTELKQRIADARLHAALSVNRELVLLYWGIGRDILVRQENEGWGAKVIDRLVLDLGRAFLEMTGLSARNLKYMRASAEDGPTSNLCNRLLHYYPGAITLVLLQIWPTDPPGVRLLATVSAVSM
jgi:DUF1016 N-terminal domain